MLCGALALLTSTGTVTAADDKTTSVTTTTAAEDLDPKTLLNTALSPDPNALIHTYTYTSDYDGKSYTIATYDQPSYPFMWNIENQYRGTDTNYYGLTKEQAQAGLDYILGPTKPAVTTTMEWDGDAPTAESPTGRPRVTFHLSNLNPGKEYSLTAHIPQLRNADLDQHHKDNPGSTTFISDASTSAPELAFNFISASDTATITATLPSSTLTPGTPYYLCTALYEDQLGASMINRQEDIDRYKEFRTPLSPEAVTEAFANAYDASTEVSEDQKAANLSYDTANTKITMFSSASGEYLSGLHAYDHALFTATTPHQLLTSEESFSDNSPAFIHVMFNNLVPGCGSDTALGTNTTGMCMPTTWSTMPVTVTPDKPSETTEPETSEPESSEPSTPATSEPEPSKPSEPAPSEPSESVKPSKPTTEPSKPETSEPSSDKPTDTPETSEPEPSEPEESVKPSKPTPDTSEPSKPSTPATSEPESSKPSEPAPSETPETSEPAKPSATPETSKPEKPTETVKPSKPTKEGDVVIQVVNNATNVTEVKNGNTITKISEPGNPTVIVITQDDKGNVISTHCEDGAGNIIPGSKKKPGDKDFEESIPVDKMPESLKPSQTNKPQQTQSAEENKDDSEKATDKSGKKDKEADKPKAKASSDNDNKPNKEQKRSDKQVGPRVVTGGTLVA